ncbi:polysaccharide pyruvyl transferase family protein [Pseudomonas gingeri]|uniref:polysaccharide pyruvyl transferase family protein n=1 Tax=Pseudomonas gingeri TaxID=117681 RepID=UPI00159FC160|nr:polysaccharide pyruvyl transferase family protein [Pseudomonas gingeri]NWA29019.1 polysaccharide pyruvyl transferase family protein [Pseudomonas gingeri]
MQVTARTWHVGIFGTFDVENYGDLLFPILAEAELSKRLGSVQLHRFSYNAKTQAEWPYSVTSLTELPALAEQLDGVLIGGGFIIRFDKVVAHGYGPTTADIHHPTGYWLSPALIAQQHGTPVVWNAPGMHCNDIPEWSTPLLKLALEHSQCVRVRDEPSRESLSALSPNTDIQVLPDTAFNLPDLIDEQHPSPAFSKLRETFGLDVPYIVIQPIHVVEPFLQLFERHPQALAGYRLLVLPIGPVLGDHHMVVTERIPEAITLPFWPAPLLLAEILGNAQAVIGHSYHLSISALVFGVPVFSTADLSTGKYTALAEMGQMHALPEAQELTEQWFTSRIGKTQPSAQLKATRVELAAYWDQVAAIIVQGKTSAHRALNRFWQHLPTLLENGAPRSLAVVEPTPTLDYMNIELNARQKQIFQLNEQLATLQNSNSFKLTAPLRSLGRGFRKLRER